MSRKLRKEKAPKTERIKNPKFEGEKPQNIQALTQNGQLYLDCIDREEVVFGIGPAGVGKSYTAVNRAVELLDNGDFHKIVLTRPNVHMGKSLGCLPGEAHEKLNPFVSHLRSLITSHRNLNWLQSQEKSGNIEFIDMAYCQGHTYDNSIVIVDEAENLSPKEMYILLTRVGKHSKMILNGDLRQQFSSGASGLPDAIHRLRNVEGVEVVTFTSDDVVRSGIVKKIIAAYEKE